MRDALLHGIDQPPTGATSRHLVWRRPTGGFPVLILSPAGLDRLCSNLAVSEPRTAWPADFLAYLQAHMPRANPPQPPRSWEFQLLSLLWELQPLALRRSDIAAVKTAMATAFETYVWEDGKVHPEWFPKNDLDGDTIQALNKSGQWGVVHERVRVDRPDGGLTDYWLLRRPLRLSHSARNLKADFAPFLTWARPPAIGEAPIADAEAVEGREEVLNYLADNWLNVAPENWTANGHRDPDNKDLGVCWQPQSYNRKLRDRYKFDEHGLPWCPTASYLSSHVLKFYPSQPERERLAEAFLDSLATATTETRTTSGD